MDYKWLNDDEDSFFNFSLNQTNDFIFRANNFRQTTNIIKESPIYSAFSFPKLNGSPSSRPIAPGITAMAGFVGPNSNHINNLTPGSSGTGSGTGFMGFGPTGFTTPIDTVLDRFGRTGTIFPVTTMGGGSHHPNNIGMFCSIKRLLDYLTA